MYQPLPHVEVEEVATENSTSTCDHSHRSEVTRIETVLINNHPFDLKSCQQLSNVCDFPVPKKVNQIRGEYGPRFYNKITVSQQLAQSSNVSLKNII